MASPLVIPVEQIDESRQLFKRPLTHAFLADVLAELPAYTVAGDAEVAAHLTRLTGRDVLLEATTTVRLESACRRCLKVVTSEVPLAFILNLVARPLPAGGKPRRSDDDDDGEGEGAASFEDRMADEELFDGERVDLGPIVREQLLLGVPNIEPVCREDCKGLCPTCGQDRNEKDCGHAANGPDPRWSALKGLKL